MLRVENLHTHYGAVHALKGVGLVVEPGEIVSLIGSNGAGKSTLVNTLTGVVKPSGGKIFFRDREITGYPSFRLAGLKIGISPEGREVFPELTVEENLRIGAYSVRERSRVRDGFQRVCHLFPRLRERISQPAGTLSGGEQQMLALGRALMADPRLLLLDEPSLGLAPNLVQMMFALMKEINRQGVTILLVEQNACMALQISHRAYVLENGNIVLEGPSREIKDNPRVKRAYLGLE